MRKVRLFLSFILASSLCFNAPTAQAVETLPQPFFKYLSSKYLADPGVILIDGATNEIVYQSGAEKPRTPASVLKLASAAAVALTLETSTVFKTAIYKTEKKGVFVIKIEPRKVGVIHKKDVEVCLADVGAVVLAFFGFDELGVSDDT